MPENSNNNDDIKDKAVSSPPKSPVNKKSNRKAKSGKSSPSKHKYDVHYHDWEDEEIANLMATVAEAPGDLGHKAKWRWIAKNMITERVFTYQDCHHAYSSHQHHLQTMKEAEISKQEEEEKEKKRLEDEAARLKLKQKNWNLAYHKRCLKWIEDENSFCKKLADCRNANELYNFLHDIITNKNDINNVIYQICPFKWIKLVEEKCINDKNIEWNDDLSLIFGKMLHFFDNFYFDGCADNKFNESVKNAREILVDTWDYESSTSLYLNEVVPLAQELFGNNNIVNNVGLAQVDLNCARVELEVIKESTYDEAFSPSKNYKNNVKKGLEHAYKSFQFFKNLVTDQLRKHDDGEEEDAGNDNNGPYHQSIYFWYFYSFHIYCRALYCSGYTTGIGAWHTSRKIQRTNATTTIDISAKMVVDSFIEKAVEDKQVKEYKNRRSVERKRLKSLNIDDLDTKIEKLRKEYRAIKKTIKKVGARAQKKCDELAHLVRETEEDKKVVVALNRQDKNNFAKQDAKRIMKKRVDVTVGVRLPPTLRNVKTEMKMKEEEISASANKVREEVDNAFTPRCNDFELAKKYFTNCLQLYNSNEIHVDIIDGFKVVKEKEESEGKMNDINDNVGVKDENDTNSTIAKKIPNTETIGNAIIEEDLVLIEKYRNMYLTNYHKALIHADIGRMNYYVAVVAEAEGLSITGYKLEPTYCYKVAIANYNKAMNTFESNGTSLCPVFAIMCEDLAEVYSRRKDWGDQSEAFTLCTKAAVIWDTLGEYDKKDHVMEQARLYSMYTIDDNAVKAYLQFQKEMRKLKIEDLEGPEERRRRIKLGLDKEEEQEEGEQCNNKEGSKKK